MEMKIFYDNLNLKFKNVTLCDIPNTHMYVCEITKIKCHGLTAYIILCYLPNTCVCTNE